jgi:hypothetical protein
MILQEKQSQGDYYDTMQVCIKNGHKITEFFDTSPEGRQNNCDECGSKTATKCSACNANIRGYHHLEHVAGGSGIPVPKFCHSCGKSYPWRKKLKQRKTRRVEVDFKNTQWFFTRVVLPILVALIVGYLLYRFNWK